jgi:hypothetical protein
MRELVVRYTLLRFGIFAGVYAVAAAIMLPFLPARVALLDAGLAAVLVSFPLAAWIGRPMRAELTDAIQARQDASRARDADDAARVEAVRQARAKTPES